MRLPRFHRAVIAVAVTVAACLWPAAPLGAQPALPAAASPQQLLEVALQRDPGVRAALAAVESARATADAADGALRPQLNYALSRYQNHLDTRVYSAGSAPGTSSSRLYGSESHNLSVRHLLWAKADQALADAAHLRVAEAEAAMRQSRTDLGLRLAEAWAEGLQAAALVEQMTVQNAYYDAQLVANQTALKMGEGTRPDVEDARARADIGAAQILQARQARQRALFRLAGLAGPLPEGLLDSATGTEDASVALVPLAPLDQWLVRAEQGSPLMAQAASRLEQAQATSASARARHLPSLSLVGQLSQGDSETVERLGQRVRQASVGLQLNVPLYAGGSLDARERAALADEARAREALAAQRLDLRMKLQEQHIAVLDGQARIVALRQVVATLDQLLVSTQQARVAGVRSSLDVLMARQRRASGQRELRAAVIDTVLARLRLQALCTGLDPAALADLAQPGPSRPS